ncbi:MAG: glycosyltransferase family 4 protein [candidate division WOR-3 bacterium]
MNILVINWQDWQNPYAGGAEVYLYEIFVRLVKKGHKIMLLCSKGSGQSRHEILDGIEIFRIGKRFNFNFYVPFALRSILRNRKVDVIIDDQNKIPFYSPLYSRKKNFIMIMHLFGKTIYRETNFAFATYVFGAEKFIPQMYPQSHFIAISQSTAEDLRNMGVKKKISVVYCGIPQVANDLQVVRQKNLVAYVGRVKKYKSIDHLIYAIDKLRKEISVELVVVGDGDARQELELLCKELDLPVDFRGFVSEGEKYIAYHRARVVVQPSIKEGWGLTAVEAQACGTPVICADSPGLRETIINGKTGYLYEYGNVDQLCNRMKDLLSDDKKWFNFSNAAREWTKKFSWDNSAEMMEEILLNEIGTV